MAADRRFERLRIREAGERRDRPPRSQLSHPSSRLAVNAVLDLQRTAGNAAVSWLLLQRDDDHAVAAPATSTALDERALAIINAAQAHSPGVDQRAVSTVQAIIDTYYPDKKSMVREVRWDPTITVGLDTESRGSGPKVSGVIKVGEDFVVTTTAANFARHVLQVGHELEHIQQHREGMGGKKRKAEREFLAFYHEGTATELAHTGRMSPRMRLKLLTEALNNYNALPDDVKAKYADQYQDLVEQKSSLEQQLIRRPRTP